MVTEQFSTSQIARMFQVTDQTIKVWSGEFEAYLSPTATPQKGKKRRFTREDVEVFSLISNMRSQSSDYEQIHTVLRSGMRGDIPLIADELTTTNAPQLVITLRERLAYFEQHTKELQSNWDMERGKSDLLSSQLQEREKLIRELYQQIARLEAKLSSE